MNRGLHYFNLAGVIVLAIICVLQWRLNRALNLRTSQLAKEHIAQELRLEEQQKQIKGHLADLDSFREHVQRSTAELKAAQSNLLVVRRESLQLAGERDQLKQSITNWTQAVAVRDEQLSKAAQQLEKLGTERNEVATRFNDLALKHNQVVEELNKRTRDFNSLVERFNTLAKAGSSKE